MSYYDKSKTSKSQSGTARLSAQNAPLIIWKERGETLAVLLERVRKVHRIAPEEKLTYAGRLDPMADGIVIVLRGDERFKKDDFLSLTKTYTVEILLGIGTDTYDPLGLITSVSFQDISEDVIKDAVSEMKNIKKLPYPLYSSRTVAGKPLFEYARNDIDVLVPEKEVEIFETELITIEKIPLDTIAHDAITDMQKVAGDFRQSESIASWQKVLEEHPSQAVQLVTVTITASSGTYMRALAAWIGEERGLPALAYRITRTNLGPYNIN